MSANSLAFTKDKNQIATPWHIVDFLYDLFNMRGKAILDPCAGHGNMLTHAGTRYGIEMDGKAYGMLCERFPDGQYMNASCFECSEWIESHHIDAVFMNPPYNADKTKGLEFVRYAADEAAKAGATICAALLPIRCGSNNPKIMTDTKRRLLEHHTLKAVIGMASDLFAPAASPGTALFIFELNKPHSGETWFAEYTYDGLVVQRHTGKVDQNGTHPKVKARWIKDYNERPTRRRQSREEDDPEYIPCGLATVTAEDEWLTQTHIEPAPCIVYREDFEATVKAYLEFQLKQLGPVEFFKKHPPSTKTLEAQIKDHERAIEELKAQIRQTKEGEKENEQACTEKEAPQDGV